MMRRLVVVLCVIGSALTMAAMAVDGEEKTQNPSYVIDKVKGKLLREEPLPEERLQVDSKISAGDILRTGWWSSAQISSPKAGARFVINSRTRVQLAEEKPGVLLQVQKGRVRAVFEKISEGESAERIVTTPSAVLAVRGTEYGVEVSKAGDTNVVVFSGVVDVVDLEGKTTPVSVSAGQFCEIRRGERPSHPMPHSMSPGDWNRGRTPSMSQRPPGTAPGMGKQGAPPQTRGGSSGRGKR